MSGVLREVEGNTVHASPMVTRPFADPKRGLIIATLAGFFMTFLGPLGTGDAPVWSRFGYWMLVMETGAVIGFGASLGIQHWGRFRQWPVIEGLLIGFLIAVPLSIVVVSSNALFFGTQMPSFSEFAFVAGVVFVFSCVITALNYATSQPKQTIVINVAEADQSSPVQSPSQSMFMERLQMQFRNARLIALEAEDHYLRVHTDAGSDLILMRLTDAIAELDGSKGHRTHRSWWVARDAVTDIQVAEGRTSLILQGELIVPVSRGVKRSLVEQGWFD